MIDLILPIWKPVDWSSFDVVKKVRNTIRDSKVGHAGTLDPFAEGVLMICSGKKTKTIQDFVNLEKEYTFEIILGYETDTLDPTGKIIKQARIPELTKKMIIKSISKFEGLILQEPPMFSALKFNGTPLYKFARKGIVIERKKRPVNIHKIILNSFSNNKINLTVQCGKGTYIRSLAKDIANNLATVGYVGKLIRTRIGNYKESNCIKINKLYECLSLEI